MYPLDNGPLYKETIMGRFPVEPWNTFSNFLFLFVLIFWSIKVYKNLKQHKFLALSLPLLLVGFVGGTIYHATRSSNLWLFMDWIPIMLLSLLVSIHYFVKQRMSFIYIIFVVILPFIFYYLVNKVFNSPEFIRRMMGYPILVIIILLPIVRWLYITKWKNWYLIILGIVCFSIAITARIIDLKADFLPMGTHWLWHSFGAIASYFLANYIFNDDLLFSKVEKNNFGKVRHL